MAERDEIGERVLEAAKRSRGYADYREWPDRQVKEWGVANSFLEAARTRGEAGSPFSRLQARGEGADPPDCEAIDCQGRRIGIEVTELVDSRAVKRFRRDPTFVAEWDAPKLLDYVNRLLTRKDAPATVRDGPYYEYFLVIHTDEAVLQRDTVTAWLGNHRFPRPRLISRAYLLLSYDPQYQTEPLVPLAWR